MVEAFAQVIRSGQPLRPHRADSGAEPFLHPEGRIADAREGPAEAPNRDEYPVTDDTIDVVIDRVTDGVTEGITDGAADGVAACVAPCVGSISLPRLIPATIVRVDLFSEAPFSRTGKGGEDFVDAQLHGKLGVRLSPVRSEEHGLAE